MKKIITICGAFLSLAAIIPTVITLTYRKTETPPATDGAERAVKAEQNIGINEAELPQTESAYKPYSPGTTPQTDAWEDKYSYIMPYGPEWAENEDKFLAPASDSEPETVPYEDALNGDDPEKTNDPDRVAAETSGKADNTTPPLTSKETEQTTKAPETTTETTTKAPVTETTAGTTGSELTNKTGEYVGCDAETIRVYMHSTGTYQDMLLGDYLIGVIVAEMPVRFDIEAIKAQAVTCRTFTVNKMLEDGYYHSSYHGKTGADICTFSGHCQAYYPYEQAIATWRDRNYTNEVYAKVKRAVTETSGIVMTYEGKPIEAAYHASSYGMTETRSNIWGGGSHPCLVGVTTPETLDTHTVYSEKAFTSDQIKKLILKRDSSAVLPDDPSEWFAIERNENNHVQYVYIGGLKINGNSSKNLFDLSSNNFTVSYDKETDTFTFKVYGWGHGVGLSQYGANIYAEQGYDFAFILKHYYSGAELTAWK